MFEGCEWCRFNEIAQIKPNIYHRDKRIRNIFEEKCMKNEAIHKHISVYLK
jgi:hypothetical protein